MKHLAAIAVISAISLGAFVSETPAQFRYTYPPTQVEVGSPGIYIKTPFWSGYFPAPPIRPPFPFPFRRGRIIVTAAPTVVAPAPNNPSVPAPGTTVPSGPTYIAPPPKLVPKIEPEKTPAKKTRPLTIEEFAKSFQPKMGNYQVVLLNPINGAATTVRFTLPDGTPKTVHVGKNNVEFRYGLRRYVRIEFDQDGAIVISR